MKKRNLYRSMKYRVSTDFVRKRDVISEGPSQRELQESRRSMGSSNPLAASVRGVSGPLGEFEVHSAVQSGSK